MEPWEIELEFTTFDEYERAIARASGNEIPNTEEYEMNEDDFKKEAEELAKKAGGEFNPKDWEVVE